MNFGCFFVLNLQQDIKRAVWKEEKWHVRRWTVSTVWAVWPWRIITMFCQEGTDKIATIISIIIIITMTFVVAGLLNVKTVDERCIRSVFCTMTSYGHQGKSNSPTPQQLVYTELLCSVPKLLSDPFIPALSVTTVSKVRAKQEKRTNFQPRVRSIYQYNQISVYIFFLIAPTKQL